MQSPGHFTRHEILSQPEAWAAALDVMRSQAGVLRDLIRAGRYDAVVFTGCGSTYYLSLAAAALMQDVAGIAARGVPASEIWLYPRSAYPARRRTLLAAVSRSGETTETIRACEVFRANGAGDVLTLSCYPDRALTRLGAINLIFPSGQEDSVAQTRAFSTLYLVTVALAGLWANRDDLVDELSRLPEIAHRLLSRYDDLVRDLASDASLDRFYCLGSGPRYGLACELSLKLKEMSLSHSEPFHFLEFRHGPKSMAGPGALIVGLLSESNHAQEIAVLDEMRKQGARVISIGERDADVMFHAGISEPARSTLYLPIGQRLAFERSIHNGLNPDRPNNLEAVVKLA